MSKTRLEKLLNFYRAGNPDEFVVYALASEYISLGNDDEALKYFLALKAANSNYLGLYYHLGKLFERKNQTEKAIKTYEEGIEIAQKQGDFKTLNEIQAALDLI